MENLDLTRKEFLSLPLEKLLKYSIDEENGEGPGPEIYGVWVGFVVEGERVALFGSFGQDNENILEYMKNHDPEYFETLPKEEDYIVDAYTIQTVGSDDEYYVEEINEKAHQEDMNEFISDYYSQHEEEIDFYCLSLLDESDREDALESSVEMKAWQ